MLRWKRNKKVRSHEVLFFVLVLTFMCIYNLSLFAEHRHVSDVKEESDDFAISEPPEGLRGGSPGSTEAGKRASAELGPYTNQSSSSKRARVSGEVS